MNANTAPSAPATFQTRIEFGFNGEYSSDHCLEYMQIPILPAGFRLQFDVPFADDDGRWLRNSDGTFTIDGSDSIRAVVYSSDGYVCSNTQSGFSSICTMVEVEGAESPDGENLEVQKVENLIKFKHYLRLIDRANLCKVNNVDSGFSREQSFFLQRRRCETVADAAKIYLGSFRRGEMRMANGIEKVLKQKWGLMFSSGPDWVTYEGSPSESKPKTVKKKRKRESTT